MTTAGADDKATLEVLFSSVSFSLFYCFFNSKPPD